LGIRGKMPEGSRMGRIKELLEEKAA